MEKTCKQCGRRANILEFRQYSSRSKGIRKRKEVGRNTICKKCESVNAQASRLYKIPKEDRTERQQFVLDKIASFYKEMKKRGNEPKGAYAKIVLGEQAVVKTVEPEGESTLSFIDAVIEVKQPDDEYAAALNKLLDATLTEAPYVYWDVLEEIGERIEDDAGRIMPEYHALYYKVEDKIKEYERGY